VKDTQFSKELNEFKQQMIQECEQFSKDITHDILEEITDKNALDTGKCTASWVASIGNAEYQEALDVTPFSRITRGQAKERSMATLSNIESYKLGNTLYLSNGTSYVSGIEDGTVSVKSILFVSIAANKYSEVIGWRVNTV
jgi:hypothetical protein